MRITKHQISNYKKNGIIKINSIITKKDCDDIIGFIKKIFIQYLKTKKINFNKNENLEKILFFTKKKFPKEYENIILKTIQRNPNVLKIGLKKEIFLILKKMGLKEPVFSTEPLIMIHSNKISEKNYAPPHQDWRSIQGSLNNVVIWIPLVKIEKKMNSIKFVKKSHLQGLIKTRKDKWFRKINIDSNFNFETENINKGDAFFLSAFTLHKSGVNKSNKARVSLQFRFNDLQDEYFIKNCYPSPYEYAKPNPKILFKENPSKDLLKKLFKL